MGYNMYYIKVFYRLYRYIYIYIYIYRYLHIYIYIYRGYKPLALPGMPNLCPQTYLRCSEQPC